MMREKDALIFCANIRFLRKKSKLSRTARQKYAVLKHLL